MKRDRFSAGDKLPSSFDYGKMTPAEVCFVKWFRPAEDDTEQGVYVLPTIRIPKNL